MRKVKFRSWDSRHKVMDIPDNIANDIDGDKYQIMQYTGLKDQNGVEIYEGDIVKFNGGAEDFFAEIGFEYGCFIAKMPWVIKVKKFGKASYPELKYYIDMTFVSTEVIGNIYENPELINE